MNTLSQLEMLRSSQQENGKRQVSLDELRMLAKYLQQPQIDPRMDHGYRQQMPGYSEYATGAINDLAPTPLDAASILPGLGEAADAASMFSDLGQGQYGDAGLSALAMLVPGIGAGVIKGVRRNAFAPVDTPPEVTVPAFRAARIYEGDDRFPGIYPAMLGKDKLGDRQQIPVGEWTKSEFRPFGMKPRKGIHAGLLPRAQQFDLKRPEYKGMMPPDMVWTRASMGADLDLSDYLNPNKQTRIYHKSDVPFENPAELPDGGFYLYSNRASDPPWLVSDYSRIDEVITDEEVNDILRSAGLPASPPRYGGAVTEARLRQLGLK